MLLLVICAVISGCGQGGLKGYSNKFVVTGGFPGSFWYWPDEKQDEYLKQMAKFGKEHKRFIFMDSSGIPDDISPENFDRITNISKKYRLTDLTLTARK